MRPINHLEVSNASNGRICIGRRDQLVQKEPLPIYLYMYVKEVAVVELVLLSVTDTYIQLPYSVLYN